MEGLSVNRLDRFGGTDRQNFLGVIYGRNHAQTETLIGLHEPPRVAGKYSPDLIDERGEAT